MINNAPPGEDATKVNAAKRVLVFDSGVGGLSVLDAIRAVPASLELDYCGDNAWLPYGLKTDEQIRERVPALVSRLCAQTSPDIVVIACNTASTIALDAVRASTTIPVVGVVPPIKPAAAMTQTDVIGLLATPATVRRPYTEGLISQFAADKRVIRFGSAALVHAAEQKLRGETPDPAALEEAIDGLFGAESGGDIDVVALACTHFPLLTEELAAAAPRSCVWLDSGGAIARRVKEVASPQQGAPQARVAAFTDAAAAEALNPAFQSRGYKTFARVTGADFTLEFS